MKKKGFLQRCELGTAGSGMNGCAGKRVSPSHNRVSGKNVKEVYEKFYRQQVAALYKAVQGEK